MLTLRQKDATRVQAMGREARAVLGSVGKMYAFPFSGFPLFRFGSSRCLDFGFDAVTVLRSHPAVVALQVR